jgi:hypothetical protein
MVLLVVFVLGGVIALSTTPAGAHFAENVNHLWKHIKQKADPVYVNVDEKAPDADKLDGRDSTGFVRANASMKLFGAVRVNGTTLEVQGQSGPLASVDRCLNFTSGCYLITFDPGYNENSLNKVFPLVSPRFSNRNCSVWPANDDDTLIVMCEDTTTNDFANVDFTVLLFRTDLQLNF